MRCNRFARSLYKCDATDLHALQMRCNRFARSTNTMQPICSLYKCDNTDLLAQTRQFVYQNERVPEQRNGNIFNKLEPLIIRECTIPPDLQSARSYTKISNQRTNTSMIIISLETRRFNDNNFARDSHFNDNNFARDTTLQWQQFRSRHETRGFNEEFARDSTLWW
jgi:hypothetical protein